MSSFEETARAAWGDDVPDWVLVLAQECERSSQNMVARKLERSAALVSQVLRCRYTGDVASFEERVRGVFMLEVVECPEVGEMTTDQCQLWRGRAKAPSGRNTRHVRMGRACNRCPRYLGEAGS